MVLSVHVHLGVQLAHDALVVANCDSQFSGVRFEVDQVLLPRFFLLRQL
jgi:hypothetical protein